MVSMFQTKGEERGMQFESKLLSEIVYPLSKGIEYVFPVIRASKGKQNLQLKSHLSHYSEREPSSL